MALLVRCARSLQGIRVVLLTLLVWALLVSSVTAAEKSRLQFAMWISSSTEVADQLALLDRYMAMNPDVEIELIYQGWAGYHDKLLTMAAGGIAPDVMVLSRLHVPSFAEAGIIRPLDEWYDQEPESLRSDVMEVISGTYKGKFYGIPIWGGPTVIEYNADLFEQAGLIQPYELAKQKTWTWDLFVEYGRKITRDTNGDSYRDIFMHAKLGTRAADWYIKVRGHGADILTPDGGAYTDVNKLERGLQFYADIAWEHRIAPVGSETSNFTHGTEAMYFTWISDVPNHIKGVSNAFRVELTTPPAGPAGLFTLVGGCPIAVSSTTPHAYEAYKFAKWYAMESGHWQLRGIPPSMDDMRREYRSYLGAMVSWPDAVVESMTGAISMEPGVGEHFNEFNSAWNPILSEVAKGNIAPREGAIRLIEVTQRILSGN